MKHIDKKSQNYNYMMENIIIRTWSKKIWAAWKVLCGEAGIVLLRVGIKNTYITKDKKQGGGK